MSNSKERRELKFLTRTSNKAKDKDKPVKPYVEPSYQEVYRLYRIICNNSMNGGDCYGTTFCLCQCSDDELYKYYRTYRKDTPKIHEDYNCTTCNLVICGCCYRVCPSCKNRN